MIGVLFPITYDSHKLSARFAIHDVCLLVISKVVVETQPMILELSDTLRLVIHAMVPQVASAGQELVLGLQQHLLLVHRRYWFLGPEYE